MRGRKMVVVVVDHFGGVLEVEAGCRFLPQMMGRRIPICILLLCFRIDAFYIRFNFYYI